MVGKEERRKLLGRDLTVRPGNCNESWFCMSPNIPVFLAGSGYPRARQLNPEMDSLQDNFVFFSEGLYFLKDSLPFFLLFPTLLFWVMLILPWHCLQV